MTAAPPRADLRTLAASAIDGVLDANGWMRGDPFPVPEDLVDAVLAAVLPEHRRMVLAEVEAERQKAAELTGWFLSNDDLRRRERAAFERGRAVASAEAADEVETEAADLGRNGHTAREEAYLAAAELVRRLAAAAPLTGPGSTEPAETAPAVPEATPDGFHEPDEPTDHIQAAFDAGLHGRTAPPRGQTRRLDVAALTYDEMEAERDRLAGEVFTLTNSEGLAVVAAELERDNARADRDRLAAQVAHYRRVVEAAKARRDAVRDAPDDDDWHWEDDPYLTIAHSLYAAVDALPGVEPHQHECACNRNWGGPCGPCVCEEPPRQGVWRLVCGAENIPPNQTYATKGAAEDVMRLHGGACPGAHGVEFVPDAGTDQTEGEKPWPGLPTPGLHLVTVEDMNTCVRCGKFTGRADCPGDTAPEGADERNGHG